MHVRVLWFGALKELLAGESERVELPQDATVEQLLARCLPDSPQTKQIARSLAVAVNREYAERTHVLHDGDEVALLPPVSGGADGGGTCGVGADDPGRREDPAAHNPVRLQRDPICPEALLTRLKQGEDGAVAVFDGVVRNNSRGRRTLYLEYEAYEPMALQQMHSLAVEAKQRFGVRQVALVHRLGRLQVGETSVWIAAASAHRAETFDACRWIIDTLKRTVPIWKKEYFEDGAIWADGEPFPEEITSRAPGIHSPA